MNNTVREFAANYAKMRAEKRMAQGVFISGGENLDEDKLNKRPKGAVYACALGAFLGAHDDEDATIIGCASNMMPEWLVTITPQLFDFEDYGKRGFHLRWADEIYLPGGIVDRANKLDEEHRVKLYAEAEQEIRQRLACHLLSEVERKRLSSISTNELVSKGLHSSEYIWAKIEGSDMRKYEERAQKTAGTIVDVLKEKLDKAGV